ncbi:hypothetical protein GCM10011575_46750 [Microlunatus endophyticus]|uniref:NADH:ubiquinone oxidoreductase 30kDa subunit domain-containing protein n=1 Tax=Microlunatus endophyticus TaxID=1716077 RepID=A0A917SHU2_9ACTN|nr:NADH-quinone oxidoreductase subunit C [Microlunatus endophyticus]GGL83103.1 hypothetical protein GCM10011575_46750 [Microlunatus endophyticus]
MSEVSRRVSAAEWHEAVAAAKTDGYDYFDWLGAVDQIGRAGEFDEGDFEVITRLVDLAAGRAVLLRTVIPRNEPRLASIVDVFAGAGWHERESGELYAIDFIGGDPRRLLLSEDYVGAPLRKDAVLGARAGIDWPGAKEPGGAPSRRRMVPPGVPEPEIWGDRNPEGEPDPEEVAQSAVGGRVRRRRR